MFSLFKKRKSESEEFLESIENIANQFIKKGWPKSTKKQQFELKLAFSFFAMYFISQHFDKKLAGQFAAISLINRSIGKKVGQKSVLKLMEDRNPYFQKLFSLPMNDATTLYSCIFICPLTLSTSDKFFFDFNIMNVQMGIERLQNLIDSFNKYLEKQFLDK